MLKSKVHTQLKGAVLINLGTPEAPTARAVRPYLAQFLMDPHVIDIPFLARWALVNLLILPTRPKKSAHAYSQIWTDRGSPLLAHSQDLVKEVQSILGDQVPCRLGMRYGSPSIESALVELTHCERISVLPLYPQYSLAATESSIVHTREVARRLGIEDRLEFLPRTSGGPAFFDHPKFIAAFAQIGKDAVREFSPDYFLFSFHGVPERHVQKTDETRTHCLATPQCCDQVTLANKNCYRAQCFATARALAKQLGLKTDQWSVSFQSRLGRTPWIKPYTDFMYKELADRGIKRLAVFCPAFVADCLETLEEIGIRGRSDFRAAGGEDLKLVPSLNSDPSWAQAVVEMLG